ncbi:MAG: hypothetical protein D3923_15695, partial [Candidatus Electrothrix sp. AR3]|nr:hypothetical protein [Candidatus Electrothrix sp. AR3]
MKKLVFCCILMLAVGWTATTWALHPLTPEQIEQKKQEGTWEAWQEHAEALGNHKMHPALVAKTKQKLSLLAQGKSAGEIDKIIPNV